MDYKRHITLSVCLCAITIMAVSAMAGAPFIKKPVKSASALDSDTYINANRILMLVANDGVFGTDLGSSLGKTDGLYFPYSSVEDITGDINTTTVVYASGLWMGALDSASGDTVITIAEYSEENTPGRMIDSTFDPSGLSDPAYRVYKIYSDSLAGNPNADYNEWPVAQGAPVDLLGLPAIIGDQMLWCVYNDANPAAHTNNAGSTAPMGVEIQQSTFAFDRQGSLGNIVFIRFKVHNRGSKTLLNTYVSLWADPDLGGASDDLVGSDTLLSLGYCYNADDDDNAYGSTPPAVGYDFFQGPLDSTGNPADTALMWGDTLVGFRNLPMSSFNKYINGTDPQNYAQTYNYMQGLNADGTLYTYNGNPTKFFVSGDPVTNTGDLDANPADRRYMLSTGPFTFRPGDSTEIIAAIIVARGGDRLNSITQLKTIDVRAQQTYANGFVTAKPPATPVVSVATGNQTITLSWTDTSEVDPGAYPFEGYAVSQSPNGSDSWTPLSGMTFDVVNNVNRFIDTMIVPTGASADTVAFVTRQLTNQGLKRTVTIRQDMLEGGRLRNLSTYYLRVEAFSYNPGHVGDTTEFGAKELVSEKVVKVVPQRTPANIEYSFGFADTIAYDNSLANSDGQVIALVTDPSALTGHTYKVSFSMDSIFTAIYDSLIITDTIAIDTSIGMVWHLVDSTTGDTLLTKQTNYSGNDDYQVVDGILVKVINAPVDFKNFEVVANASGPLDPSESGAFASQGFPVADNPGDNQQVGDGHWLIHTGDNGGSADGGTRGDYTSFFNRTTRNGSNFTQISVDDYEIRFTGDPNNPGVEGGYALDFFGGFGFWVPFEIWNIGSGTPGDSSDDFRMVPYVLNNFDDSTFNLESWGSSGTAADTSRRGGYEHSTSGADNDPYTDWVYWYRSDDSSAGETGYLAAEAEIIAGTYVGDREHEVFARMVLVNWNGGPMPPFNQDMPEQGTIFRISTTKPILLNDVFAFTSTAGKLVTGDDRLNNVKVVPNPYYLFSSYDASTFRRAVKFSNLPTECSISIYTLAGDFMRRLDKNSPESFMDWDIENADGIPIASGIYIYVVTAPGMGQKIGKMAIFTEEEQLRTY